MYLITLAEGTGFGPVRQTVAGRLPSPKLGAFGHSATPPKKKSSTGRQTAEAHKPFLVL